MKQKKSKLTLYIVIGILLGILLGCVLNKFFINEYNQLIIECSDKINDAQVQLSSISDKTSSEYALLQAEIKSAQKVKTETMQIIEDRLMPFTIMSDIFIRLIKMIVAPLVLTTLVVGVAKVGGGKSVGRIGGKAMLWFLAASFISLSLGLIFVNIFRPGDAMNLLLPDTLDVGIKNSAVSLKDFIVNIFPKSIIDAMAKNDILPIVVFALFFGVAAGAIGEQGAVIIKLFDALAHTILKVASYVMLTAPFAVFGAMTSIIAKQGLSILSTYALYIVQFYFSLGVLCLIIVGAGGLIIGKRIKKLIPILKDPMLLAFSTSSSEVAFPKLMEQLERFGCKNNIVSFILPLGYSFNLDGGMMFITFGSLFIAQAYGIELSFMQQLMMLLVLMITSKGVAGVPRAGLVIIAGTLAMFNIPEAGLALLLGIEPILDMGRSATNVLGNGVAVAVISKWEGELGKMHSEKESIENIPL